MAYRNRFYKTTPGVDAQIFVAPAVEYTTDADLKDFTANAAEGEMALINAATGAVLTSAAAATVTAFFVQKRDGNVESSTPFLMGNTVREKVAYVAPVKHAITITDTVGEQASLVVQDITFTAVLAGADGNDITIAYADTGTAGAETVVVTGTDVVVGIESGVSTATQVLAALVAESDFTDIASAAITGTAATAQVTAAEAPLAGGVDSTAVVKGDFAEILIIETTPGLEPLPRWSYSTEVKANETLADVLARIVAKINNANGLENQNKTLIITATQDGTDVVLTAIDYNVHFTVALRGILADEATFAVTAQFKIGSGTPEQAELAEDYGDIRKGVTTNYPEQNANPADFGEPTSFVSSSETYDIYKATFYAEDQTRTLDKEFRKNYIFVYVAKSGSNPGSEFTTVLGL